MSAALKLAAGFALAAALVIFLEAVLAVFPDPLWTTLLLLPLVAAAAVGLDSARRRRAWARPAVPRARPAEGDRGRPAPSADPDVPGNPEDPAIASAMDRFNESAFPRTIAGIAKALGAPRASIVPLPGSPDAVALTIAWELSWYRYRLDPTGREPVAVEARGEELDELDERFTAWNVVVAPDGRVALQPEQARSAR